MKSTEMTPKALARMINSVDYERLYPSPETPTSAGFDLAKRFQEWPSEFPQGRPVTINPDPILYPEQRRQSTEYKPLFSPERRPSVENERSTGVERLRSPLKLQPPPQFLQRDISSTPAPQSVDNVSSAALSTAASANSEPTTEEVEEAQLKEKLIDEHYRKSVWPNHVPPKSKVTKWSKPKNFTPPTREQYALVYDVAFTSKVFEQYAKDPASYRKRQLAENEVNYRVNKQSRTGINHKTVSKSKEFKPLSLIAPVATARVRKTVKKQVDRSGTPEVKHRRTAVKKTKALFHYNDIPDFAPSVDTIPSEKVFRVTWAGQPLDLSNDPDRHLLHPAELLLASKLRFPCDQYLKTKRRVFVGRVNNLVKYPKKQFCKTDAQQVGGVDVNKLSQLWEAYNSIDWFKGSHFDAHVRQVLNAESVYDPKNTKWVPRQEFFGF